MVPSPPSIILSLATRYLSFTKNEMENNFNFRNLLKKSIPYVLAVLAFGLALLIWMNTQQYRDLQNKQQELISINQQIVDNSTEWQRLEDLQKQLAASNQTLRSKRDQLETLIANQMGLGTGGGLTPSTTTRTIQNLSAQGS